MIGARRSALAAFFFATTAFAAPPKPRVAIAPVHIAQPLPSLPTIPHVHLEVARDHVLVVQDIRIARGDWTAGDLDVYVAFGAAVPTAFDAKLIAESNVPDSGEVLTIDRAPRRPPSADALLGRVQMAGAIIHMKDGSLRRAFAPLDSAILRVRTLLPAPTLDADSASEVVVRLGITNGEPLTLGAIDLTSTDPSWVTRAEAHLCGDNADPYPLAIEVTSKKSRAHPGIAPDLATRHATDDLCVRFFTKTEASHPLLGRDEQNLLH